MALVTPGNEDGEGRMGTGGAGEGVGRSPGVLLACRHKNTLTQWDKSVLISGRPD